MLNHVRGDQAARPMHGDTRTGAGNNDPIRVAADERHVEWAKRSGPMRRQTSMGEGVLRFAHSTGGCRSDLSPIKIPSDLCPTYEPTFAVFVGIDTDSAQCRA